MLFLWMVVLPGVGAFKHCSTWFFSMTHPHPHLPGRVTQGRTSTCIISRILLATRPRYTPLEGVRRLSGLCV